MIKNRNYFLKEKNGFFAFILVMVFMVIFFVFGCGTVEEEEESGGEISFSPVIVPSTDVHKTAITSSSAVTIDGSTYPIEYLSMMKSGDRIGNETFGLILDQDNRPVYRQDGTRLISSNTDFTSMLQIESEEIIRRYAITNFESLPGAMYLTRFGQISDLGLLSPSETHNIDFKALGGVWKPSGGSVTPWETHLSGEKQEPDARRFQEVQSINEIDPKIISMLRYLCQNEAQDMDTIRTCFNPYLYGHPIEVTVDIENEISNVNKRYALGRFSIEQAYVMPDEKTVYISDAGSNGGLFLFVADNEGDLSSGNLFAAKWNQEDSIDGGSADLDWIELGHATEDAIKASVAQRIRFTDIFNIGQFDQDTHTCPEGFTNVNTGEYGPECLAVRVGMEVLASRLETRRYAAMLGATTEFSTIEGIAYAPKNVDGKRLYVAINKIDKGMEDNMSSDNGTNAYDRGGENHIRLPHNGCGCIYSLELGKSDGVGSEYTAQKMYSELCGEMRDYGVNHPYHGNTCDVDNIANPNGLTFIPKYKTLIIGETSEPEKGHVNDAIWSYHVDEGQLTRIQTTPQWGISTSPYFYTDIGDFSYLMSVIQYPFEAAALNKLADIPEPGGIVGFIGPMPKFD
jgi:hypothetical protein